MSRMYNQIKKWYDDGFWSKKKVHDALEKGMITLEEYYSIVGEEE